MTENSGREESTTPRSTKLEVGAKFETSRGPPVSIGSETPGAQGSRSADGVAADGTTDNKASIRADLGRFEEKDFGKRDNSRFNASAGFRATEEVQTGDDPASAAETPKDIREQANKSASDAKTINNFYIRTNYGDIAALLQQAAAGSAPGVWQPGDTEEARAKLWSFAGFVLSQDRISDLSYALALAALSGAPVSAVNRAAEDLGERLLPPVAATESERQKAGPIQVVTPRRIVLAELNCEFFSGTVTDSEGVELTTERVRFRDRGMDQILLRDAWLNLRLSVGWMGPFLRWLTDQGRSNDLELRLAAGRTAGFLATWDSGSAESILFHSWTSGRAIDALGAALLALAGTSKSAETYVEKRLIGWTEGEGGRTRIITAAILASGAFGHASPDMGFPILASLVRQKRYLTLDLAAMGYAVWFASAASDLSLGARVIAEVNKLRSVRDDKIIQKLTGYYFLLLTAALDDDDDDDEGSEKLFLQVLGASAGALRTAADLFNELLAPNIHAKAALERFRSICLYAFRTSSGDRRTFVALAEAMYAQGDQDQRDTLHYWLEYWLEEVQEYSTAAGLALGTLLENFSNGALAT